MLALLSLALRRLAVLPVTVLGVTLLVFVVMQFSPADPAFSALGQGSSPEARAVYAAENGLDDPLPQRYVRFLGDMAQGDFGMTVPPSQPVLDRIATALPLTFQLTFLGLALAVVLSVAMGVAGAVYRDRWPDHLTRVVSLAGVAVPSFWLGILLIQQFALNMPVFPSGGYTNPADSVSGWLYTMTLPVIALAVPVAAQLTRLIRTSLVTELDRDYVRTARGNGLPGHLVIRAVLRNAMVTPLTVLGLRVAYLIGGAVVIETIFSLPGMGMLILEGIDSGDLALVQGTVITVAIGFLLVNLVVDLLYLLANPRIRAA